jgi:hypothetical protein
MKMKMNRWKWSNSNQPDALALTLFVVAMPSSLPRALAIPDTCYEGILAAWCYDDDPPGPCDDAVQAALVPPASNDCNPCDTNSPPRGMPRWWVSEPRLNVRFSDEPLAYHPAKGLKVSFKLAYRQRGATSWPSSGPRGMLTSEDGPWASDALTLGYANRLRSRLSLQQPAGS